jgi:hypothetical protein
MGKSGFNGDIQTMMTVRTEAATGISDENDCGVSVKDGLG